MEASRVEQRAVVRFLTAEGAGPREIHRRMTAVYRNPMGSTTVKDWSRRFREGRSSLADDPRPGQAHRAVTGDTVAEVDRLIREDRRVAVAALAVKVGISVGSVHTIVREHLKYRRICAQWVPHNLTPVQMDLRMGLSLEHLLRYRNEGQRFIERIVTGDETWCFHFQPESKRQSTQWKHASSPPPRKPKGMQTTARKVLLTFFFDHKGPLLMEFITSGTTVNAARYVETLKSLRASIKSKRPGLLSRGVLLLHDNARPHTARVVQESLVRFGWEVLQHPAYSPDLSPCDFHVFGELKRRLRGRRFQSDVEVKDAVREWCRQQPADFYERGIERLVSQWDKCLTRRGDYL